VAVIVLGLAAAGGDRAAAAPSGDELVRQARAHEAARDDDLAARRYTEALTIDPTNGDAWLGLGTLRMRLGDAAEAERVFAAALARVPGLSAALAKRAEARWALGRRADAEADLESYAEANADTDAYRRLGAWFGVDGRWSAQLATWRRLLALAVQADNQDLVHEAERTVRALVIVVDGADPAASPPDGDETRRALAAIARRANHPGR
jgi:tetratricopeptide (TPR) repeat protein